MAQRLEFVDPMHLDRLSAEVSFREYQKREKRGDLMGQKQTENKFSHLYDQVKPAVSQLTSEDQLLVRLRFWDSMNLDEIGVVVGQKRAVVAKRLDLILKTLRKIISESIEQPPAQQLA
jgi:DNA-directed RNA polymerase specialized sigma subunit